MFEKHSYVFKSAALKYLSVVDASTASNQHEIGGIVKAGIGEALGMPDDGRQVQIGATFVYPNEDRGEPIVIEDMDT